MSWLVGLVGVVVLVAAATLRAAGASLVSTARADALHDAADGTKGAATVAQLLEDRSRIQPAISLVHSSLLVSAVLVAAWLAAGSASGIELGLLLIGSGGVVVLLGDLMPRSLGRSHPRRIAYRWARLLSMAVSVGDRAVDAVNDEESGNGFPAESDQGHDSSDRDEIRMISSVLEFSDAIVREVMIPRTDMVTLTSERTTTEALDLILQCGFSRIPVTGRGSDDIVGMVYAKDLLRETPNSGNPVSVREICRQPYFVPESKLIRELLREMQAKQIHLAIAVDEFGGTAGLVTIEDLLEELVGEIVDEYDTESPMVEQLGDGRYLVAARLAVDDLNRALGTELPDDEWDTVGGLVLGLAGRVPREGERFTIDNVDLVTDRVQGRRVERVIVERAPLPDRQ